MRSSRSPGSYSGRGGLPLWRLRAGCAPQTAHGAITGATRTSNAIPERSALKTTPVVRAPHHDRARGRNPPESRLVRARLQFERPDSVRSRDGHMYMNRDVCKPDKPPAEVISRAQNNLFRESRFVAYRRIVLR
ncbi:hypothetical protein GEV33_000694 [Tenebrio molitor]|uniref:Uncharacterized protein n=1 Tax=Tenebrio molitor TaxID=7067 RepID=A0A8J6LKP1_TENMO|nr:hypothetical protein GEV33_000694 [Tenebrio molitor]